jgi:SAM-dependent methyltransferase
MKKLADSQVEAFDTEYVDGSRWATVKARIDEAFPAGEFSFLDVGGGNGRFADRLLAHYPKAIGTVLDSSELLLSRNQTNERKTVICDSVENLGRLNAKYDLICVHWLLHHLVGDSYTETRQNQSAALQILSGLLNSRGRASVFENMYNGWLLDNLPGQLIYHLTSAKSIASLTRWMGANTGGVGVCYLSTKEWFRTIHAAGLRVLSYVEPDTWRWPLRPGWRMLLHIRDIRVAHFWLSKDADQ